jgi:hypothetical protein
METKEMNDFSRHEAGRLGRRKSFVVSAAMAIDNVDGCWVHAAVFYPAVEM